MTRLWIVRAGAHGERELAAIDQSKLFPGFLEVGDLSACADRDAVLAHLQEVMPDEGKNRLWQMPDLLKALFRTYGELSDETRAKLPLKQIWAPMTGGT